MEKVIKKETGVITKLGTYKKGRQEVPARVKLNMQKYLDAKNKDITDVKNK